MDARRFLCFQRSASLSRPKSKEFEVLKKEKLTRNGGKWTEGRFEGFVTSILRGGMRRWAPKHEALKNAYTTTKLSKSKRQAKHYRCASCEEEFTSTNVQVDHREPIGKCKTWDEFIERLFCEVENLQVLCKPCHKEKTKKERLENQ